MKNKGDNKFMVKVCLHCFEIYKSSLKEDEWIDSQPCPKSTCIGKVVEVDELLLPTIIELNKKKYFTKYCCSGHYYQNPVSSYIMFEDDIDIPSLPKGYVLENEKNTIRKSFSDHCDAKNYKYVFEIYENAKSLLKWAKSLAYNNEY